MKSQFLEMIGLAFCEDPSFSSKERNQARGGKQQIILGVLLILLTMCASIVIQCRLLGIHLTMVFGRPAYYIEEITDIGFIYRTYYHRGSDGSCERIGESWGYTIRDNSSDIDNDGIPELLCTCEYGGDGVIELHCFKKIGDEIVEGTFSASNLNFSDYLEYGAGSFNTYYLPDSDEMLADYTTKDGLSVKELSIDQVEFKYYNSI